MPWIPGGTPKPVAGASTTVGGAVDAARPREDRGGGRQARLGVASRHTLAQPAHHPEHRHRLGVTGRRSARRRSARRRGAGRRGSQKTQSQTTPVRQSTAGSHISAATSCMPPTNPDGAMPVMRTGRLLTRTVVPITPGSLLKRRRHSAMADDGDRPPRRADRLRVEQRARNGLTRSVKVVAQLTTRLHHPRAIIRGQV